MNRIKKELNIVYFSIFLLTLLTFILLPFYIWGKPLSIFFFLYALGQGVLEAGLCILIGTLLNRWAPRWLFHTFIALSFVLLLLHFVNFTIIRLMDAPLSHLFKYLFGTTLIHTIAAFNALNVNPIFLLFIAVGLISLPLIGLLFYRLTEPLAKKITWEIPLLPLCLLLFSVSGALVLLDWFFHPVTEPIVREKFEKTLPLGKTFLPSKPNRIALEQPLAPCRDEKNVQLLLQQHPLSAKTKPNIYLFIVETFRKDYVTEEIAPHLFSFGQKHLSFPESYANSNSTNTSWFAIFHSLFPYHWTAVRDQWQRGSVPLQLFKELGYKIRIYSSADLHLFEMDRVLLGKERTLADQIEEFTEGRLQPYERDALCFQSLYRDLTENKEGNLFVFFLDSTHSEYSFPKELSPFIPYAESIDYLTLTPDQLEPVKNRYRNAIHYVDSLFGQFFAQLNVKELYNEAVIVITGDHGEEFFEEGSLFHGTHLNRYQTSVPLLYKFGPASPLPNDTISTHIDIFPSILHYLTGQDDFASLFDGESLFSSHRRPYYMAVMQNGPMTPNEFTLSNLRHTLHLRYQVNELEVLSSTPETPPFYLDLLKK